MRIAEATGSWHIPMLVESYWPWRALRDQSTVVFGLADLPDAVGGACYLDHDVAPLIMVDRRLSQAERRVAVGHELLHHERGLTGDCAFDHHGLDDENARRLVPAHELAAMRAVAVANDLCVEVWQVAERFGVTYDVAERAMRLLDAPHPPPRI